MIISAHHNEITFMHQNLATTHTSISQVSKISTWPLELSLVEHMHDVTGLTLNEDLLSD